MRAFYEITIAAAAAATAAAAFWPHLLSRLPLEAQMWLNGENHTSCPYPVSQCIELLHTECCTKVGHWHWVTINLVAGSICGRGI
jgi:hypothetical protein